MIELAARFPWRAAAFATVVGAFAGVVLMTVVAAGVSGRLEGETLFFMTAVAFPVAILVAAPVGFVVLPLARLLLDRVGQRGLRWLVATGAVAGFALPLAVAIATRSRLVMESWVIAGIYVLASTLAGAVGALVYHRLAPREPEPGAAP